jgi:hypothetical protein
MANLPNVVGQSGTASPASLLVTSAPAMIRIKVVQATKTANAWCDRLYGVVADFRTHSSSIYETLICGTLMIDRSRPLPASFAADSMPEHAQNRRARRESCLTCCR